MNSELFTKAKIQMEKACHVSVVLAIIAHYHRDISFPESVELIDLAQIQLNKIYGVK